MEPSRRINLARGPGGPHSPGKARRLWKRWWPALLAVAGLFGIILSPIIGVAAGKLDRTFKFTDFKLGEVYTLAISSDFTIATVNNSKGLFWMSVSMLMSVCAVFYGVYRYSKARAARMRDD